MIALPREEELAPAGACWNPANARRPFGRSRQQRRVDPQLLVSFEDAEDARRAARMTNESRRALPLPRYLKPLRAETS
jgi:hypothetical protein